MQFLTTLLSALVLAVSTTATHIHTAKRSELIVVSPTITSPTAGVIWPVGSTQLVTWDTSDIPPSGQSNTGTILLGYYDNESSSENLNYTNPLAYGFLLTAGCQSIVIPSVIYRDTYFIVLLGDSGNASPDFTILQQ